MKLAASLLLPFLLLSAPLHAADKTPAERLLVAMDFEATSMAAAKASFSPAIDQFKQQGLPAEAITKLTAAADAFFVKTFTDPGFRTAMAKLYSSKFTDSEIEELIKFYATPIGKKSLTAMPELMGDAAKLGEEYAEKNAPGFQEEIQAIITKYKPAAGGKAEEKEDKDQ